MTIIYWRVLQLQARKRNLIVNHPFLFVVKLQERTAVELYTNRLINFRCFIFVVGIAEVVKCFKLFGTDVFQVVW